MTLKTRLYSLLQIRVARKSNSGVVEGIARHVDVENIYNELKMVIYIIAPSVLSQFKDRDWPSAASTAFK